MDNKLTKTPVLIVTAIAAAIGLIVTIVLILTNPSRFPQGISTISPTTIMPTPTPRIETIETSDEGKQKAITLAKQNLAKTMGIPESQISIVSAQETTWPDSSLGCPQPGFFYTQVITPGYQIILKAQSQEYDYRADTSEHITVCNSGSNK